MRKHSPPQLQPCLDRPLEQLSPVERAVLLVAAFELKHHLDIPYRVVINEAVELTKTFGGSDGYKYVNGVLDKLAGPTAADRNAKPRAASEADEFRLRSDWITVPSEAPFGLPRASTPSSRSM